MSRRPNLQLVRERPPEQKCSIAATVSMAGRQEVQVRGVTAMASPRGFGHVAIRVGRVLLYVEDRDALEALQEAVRRAVEVAEPVFEPLDSPRARLGR